MGSLFGFPCKTEFVGNCASNTGASSVSPKADQHNPVFLALQKRFDSVALNDGGFVAVIRYDRIIRALAGIQFHGNLPIKIFVAAHDFSMY